MASRRPTFISAYMLSYQCCDTYGRAAIVKPSITKSAGLHWLSCWLAIKEMWTFNFDLIDIRLCYTWTDISGTDLAIDSSLSTLIFFFFSVSENEKALLCSTLIGI